MAVTITLNLTEMYDFDSDTNVTSSQGTPDPDTDFYIEGTASVAAELRTAGMQWMKYTRPTGSWDLQNTHIFIWVNCIFASLLATKASGGLSILVGDGTNVGYWYCEGSDTYGGGWVCLVVDTSRTIDLNDGADPSLAAITEIGVGINFSTTGKNVESTWVDIARYGDGITITSDTLCDLDDILTEASSTTNASGVLRKEGGVFFAQGKLRFGSTTTGTLLFEDSGEILVFEDKYVSSDLYEIIVQGNTNAVTSFQFGTKVGAIGVSGLFIDTAGTLLTYGFTATDIDIDTLNIYGSIFSDSGTLELSSTIDQLLNTSFNNTEILEANTAHVRDCIFNNANTIAVKMIIGHDIEDCGFNNCPNGVLIDTAGTYTFDNLVFTGCTYDILNTSGGTVTVNATNGANPSSQNNPNGGTVDIINTVYLRVYCNDEAGDPVASVRVAIYDTIPVELMNELTTGGGLAEETYNYLGDEDIEIRARKQGYIPVNIDAVIESGGMTSYITMVEDPNYGLT